VTVCQNWTVQVCAACELSFDWHPFCDDFDTYSNDDGYFVVDNSEINGLDMRIREEISANLWQNHQIMLNSSVKVFNSFTRMIAATRSFWYTSTEEAVIPHSLCDVASAPITMTGQREQCSLCASVKNYDYIEHENACCIDFSVPLLYPPTTVLYRKNIFFKEGHSFFSLFIKAKFVKAICNIICWIMLYSTIILFLNPAIFDDKKKKCGAKCARHASTSIWMAVATFTTVGYGDYVVRRRLSRFVTILYMFFSMVFISYLIGVVLELFSDGGSKSYLGLEHYTQISGRTICIPGYYYYIFEDMVRKSGGMPIFKNSFKDCTLCLTEPNSTICSGINVAGVLYDYPVFVGFLAEKPELKESLAIAELGVYPRCQDCVTQVTIHWAIPDRRYLEEDFQLPSSVHDKILDEISYFVGSVNFSSLLPEFDLQLSYEQIDSSYLGNVDNGIHVHDYLLLIEAGTLTLFCFIIFSLGEFSSNSADKKTGSFYAANMDEEGANKKVLL